jgi:S-DNA-T family DNA segregation ATPase FtsK/SpoIIIE
VFQEGVGVVLVGTALLSVVALGTYLPSETGVEHALVESRSGVVGATLAAVLFRAAGYGAFVLVGALGWIGIRLAAGRGVPGPTSRFWVGAPLLLIAVAAIPPLLSAHFPEIYGPGDGGALGGWLARNERWLVGSWGAVALNGLLGVVGALGVVGISTGRAASVAGAVSSWLGGVLWMGSLAVFRFLFAILFATWERLVRVLRSVGGGVARAARSSVAGISGAFNHLGVWREQRARRARVAAARAPAEEDSETAIAREPSPLASSSTAADTDGVPRPPRPAKGGEPAIIDHLVEPDASRKPEQAAFHFEDRRPSGPYQRPDLSIFQKPEGATRPYDRDSLIMNSRILEKKLLDFGVAGRVVTVHPGPVVTMYEFEPASGVKVNRIVSLSDDLALALRALSVRIIAPLPGKSVVGIEVANPERELVYLRDLLESESFRASKSPLTLALGKDIFGNPAQANLAKMPHLLVAGATGTGKSVFLNALLCSLLCRASPDELKLLLVDPKLLELSVYEGIPHLIADVVTNPKRAAAALMGIVHKMEERYQMMAALGVRSIDQFNERVDKELAAGNTSFRLKAKRGEEEGAEVPFERIPYIVVVIDELADLMVVSARDVEEALQRLAQMARAAGIHLVLATQRPSVDVLTGIIKANFPARISFQVSSRTDSRTILDQNGADHLLGQGDMLFLPPGTSKLQRLHGAYVSEDEVAALAKFLRTQGSPVFDETLTKLREESEAKEDGTAKEDVDEMYDKAVALVAETRNASISYVQRRLKVGYNRAARMIEQMENEGVVGPQVGTKPREVFVQSIEA